MTVDELKRFVEFIINKEQSGNSITPDQFNLLLGRASDDYFKLKYGLPEEYQPGSPLPRQAYAVSQKIIDDLRPFIKTGSLTIDAEGKGKYPTDYVHVSAVRYMFITQDECGDPKAVEKTVTELEDNQVAEISSHSLRFPTKEYPYYTFYSDHIQFFPNDLNTVKFNYLKYPEQAVWGFEIENDVAVYNPDTSTQLPWPKITHNDIARMILSYEGINLREQQLIQYVETIKAKGV